MIANSRCIACILSKQERKIRKNSDEQKKKEYIHKVLKILYEYGTKEVAYLEDELAQAKTLLYITDNCGEIVLDKIFIEELQNKYKNLQITAMVRGGIASNDATMEDAEEIGLTNVVPVIGNGAAIMGTVKEQLSEEAKEKIQNADVIIAKGMGNFESMYQEEMNPYYLLLCKCELYKETFGVEMFQPIFCKEERL